MKKAVSKFVFGFLEALIVASLGAFVFALIVPDLFSVCVGSTKAPTCASFGVFNILYKEEKIQYEETTILFVVIRAMVLICAVLVLLSVFAALLGYMGKSVKVLPERIIFLTMTALITLSVVYSVQWCQSKLYGTSVLKVFPFHDLRPISQNLALPYFMVSLYPMILVFFFMGIFLTDKKEKTD
ncbi:hypothetical protein RF11_13459 [Thelohanellus kitauei]|uniref:Uncharacterized protein n=1 Tax=Thelohanellus kitauei TaxID=669202 RepID=A0A0C2INC3_THEKT|nr:hypothetical protein RF11_13459 [Thelohanellus kitauei]